jgi:hypothetical protein
MSDSNFDRFLRRVHSDCVNASDAPGGELSQEGAARLVSAAFNLNGEAEKLKAEEREALLESFAMRAPAVPDWFAPEMPPNRGGLVSHEFLLAEARQRVAQWPWAYAEMVLAARPGGAK